MTESDAVDALNAAEALIQNDVPMGEVDRMNFIFLIKECGVFTDDLGEIVIQTYVKAEVDNEVQS